jgi:hypothetical protein
MLVCFDTEEELIRVIPAGTRVWGECGDIIQNHTVHAYDDPCDMGLDTSHAVLGSSFDLPFVKRVIAEARLVYMTYAGAECVVDIFLAHAGIGSAVRVVKTMIEELK